MVSIVGPNPSFDVAAPEDEAATTDHEAQLRLMADNGHSPMWVNGYTSSDITYCLCLSNTRLLGKSDQTLEAQFR
jgi:hypothetical protein